MKKILIYIICFATIFTYAYANEGDIQPDGYRIAREAAHWLGSPYGHGTGDDGYGSPVDCSGLVYRVYKTFGVELPRVSYEQAETGEYIPLNEMIPGDIVCFIYEDGNVGHVGIYLGGRTMIHSPRPGKTVEFSHNFENWESLNIKAVYGRRISGISYYTPEPLPENIEAELNKYLGLPNSLKTDHIKNEDLPEEKIEEIITEIKPLSPSTIILQIDNPTMIVNGNEMDIDNDNNIVPIIINNRTHLPLRNVSEELGATVEWIGGVPGQINVHYNGCTISLWLEKEYAMVNDQKVFIDSAPILVNDKTYLPIRFIADEFGWEVSWDGNEKTVTISNNISD